MEQKIERLENEVTRINTDISESAIRTVCSRINDQAFIYIPKI